MALGDSFSSTPTWAVATVTAILIVFSLLIEHSLHILTRFVDRRKRQSLNQSMCQIKGELRNFGFISLLLTMAEQPISKICISGNLADTFLPCEDKPPPAASFQHLEDADACTKEGKVSLMSSNGVQQLQLLIFLLAVFHVVSSLLTLGLGEIKMKKWGTWEEKARTLEYQLSNDPRRFKLAKQTSFGKRHLQSWSSHWPLLWIVCFGRQFAYSLSRADYFALRNGYIDAHLSPNTAYNFHKFLRRSLDKDFKELVTISPAIWMCVIMFILFNAHVFYNHYWLPFIPLLVLLAIGTKLEVIITKTCLKSSKHKVIVPGDQVYVSPNDELFWFGRPRWILHAIHFILIQNSFQMAFITWSSYKFGFQSCFHRESEDFSLSLSGSILVQFLCAYITLPLYSLVNQMGSTVRETIFSDRVVVGLKNWRGMAKKSLFSKESVSGGNTPPAPSVSDSPLMASPRAGRTSSWWTHHHPQPSSEAPSSSSFTPAPASTSSRARSYSRTSSAAAMFEYPTRRRELEEIQKVTEEMMVASRGSGGSGGLEGGGEMSFRMWWKQEMTSPIGGRRSSSRVAFSGVDVGKF